MTGFPVDADPTGGPDAVRFPEQWVKVADMWTAVAEQLRVIADDTLNGRTCAPDCRNPLCGYVQAERLVAAVAERDMANLGVVVRQGQYVRDQLSKRN